MKPISCLISEKPSSAGSSAAASSSKSNPKKEQITVSSILSAMDNKPKSKDAFDLPPSDDEDEDEEIQPQGEEIGILTAKSKPRSLRSAGPADLSAATLSEKEVKKREKKDMLAAQAAELARKEALKDDRNAFTVVIGDRSSALDAEGSDAAASNNVPTRASASKFFKYRSSQQQSATGADVQLEKVLKTDRFNPDRAFTGASERPSGCMRERPVEFDQQEEDDPFGLEEFLKEVKRGKKAMDKIGGGGTMRASVGGGSRYKKTFCSPLCATGFGPQD